VNRTLFKSKTLQRIVDQVDNNLLIEALTHTTFALENDLPSYQRLEFLGDAILQYVVSDYLFKTHPDWNEQQYTEHRQRYVSAGALNRVYDKYQLKKFVLLGNGLTAHPEQISDKMGSDIVEALIGAVYISTNIEIVKEFIVELMRLKD
jgi:ribonuclease-3